MERNRERERDGGRNNILTKKKEDKYIINTYIND